MNKKKKPDRNEIQLLIDPAEGRRLIDQIEKDGAIPSNLTKDQIRQIYAAYNTPTDQEHQLLSIAREYQSKEKNNTARHVLTEDEINKAAISQAQWDATGGKQFEALRKTCFDGSGLKEFLNKYGKQFKGLQKSHKLTPCKNDDCLKAVDPEELHYTGRRKREDRQYHSEECQKKANEKRKKSKKRAKLKK